MNKLHELLLVQMAISGTIEMFEEASIEAIEGYIKEVSPRLEKYIEQKKELPRVKQWVSNNLDFVITKLAKANPSTVTDEDITKVARELTKDCCHDGDCPRFQVRSKMLADFNSPELQPTE